MKRIDKKTTKKLFTILGGYSERYRIPIIIFYSVILAMNIGFTIGWYFSPDDVSRFTEAAFYSSQSVLFVATLLAILSFVLNIYGKLHSRTLGLIQHIFAFVLMVWGVLAFCFDLSLGFSPLLFILVCTFVAGVIVIDPIYFSALELLSLIPLFITIARNPNIFFKEDQYLIENIILFIALMLLDIVIVFRNYQIIRGEHRIERKLHVLSYNDELTGLLNERSYVNEVEIIDKKINAGQDIKFAVILMDVNNLKATNDAYGHRYGCSLIVRCGHTLPEIFHTSKLFHVGGDEFVAIVYDKDLEEFEETMKRFDEKMLYSIVQFDGQDLIFSVARGYHIRQEGQHYKDVLQIADKAMYENKKYLKEKYNMKSR